MKKIGRFIGDVFLSILAVIIGLLILICLPFAILPDYIRYKKSAYYKKERKKYTGMAASSLQFKIYHEIQKNNLPITYIENPSKDAGPLSGWFVYEDTLLIVSEYCFDYDLQTGIWSYCVEDEEEEVCQILSLEEYIEAELENVNKIGTHFCKRAMVLFRQSVVEDVDAAKEEPRFLLYDGNAAEVLKTFLNNGKDIS